MMQANSRHAKGADRLALPALFAAAVSGAWVLGPRSWFPTWHGFPNTASTTLLFLVAVAAANSGAPPRYRWSIAVGLACSAAGDAFLMVRGDYFVAGLASFLAAHVCYLWAFTSDSRLANPKWPFVAWTAWAVGLVSLLWPGVAGSLRAPVVLYTAALAAMAAQAASRAISRRSAPAILAAAGASLFVASDSVLAFQRFRQPLSAGHLIVLGTYFAAQAGIALSAVLGSHGPATRLGKKTADRMRPAVAQRAGRSTEPGR